MKLVMMAAALMLGTAAIAQTTTQEETDNSTETTTDTPTDTTDTTTDMTTPPDAATSMPPPATTTTTTDMMTTTDSMPMAPAAPGNMSTMRTGAGQAMAPGNASPKADARGIRVVSDSATAPAGYNDGARTVPAGSPMPTMAPPTPTASGPLPPCTRAVTDRCTQTYERGRAR